MLFNRNSHSRINVSCVELSYYVVLLWGFGFYLSVCFLNLNFRLCEAFA